MTATYIREGRGRSWAAEKAESKGRMPMTRAIKELRVCVPCTIREAREVLEETYDGEWHHVGKYANACNYYDVGAAARLLAKRRLAVDPGYAAELETLRAEAVEARRLARIEELKTEEEQLGKTEPYVPPALYKVEEAASKVIEACGASLSMTSIDERVTRQLLNEIFGRRSEKTTGSTCRLRDAVRLLLQGRSRVAEAIAADQKAFAERQARVVAERLQLEAGNSVSLKKGLWWETEGWQDEDYEPVASELDDMQACETEPGGNRDDVAC